MGTRGSAKKPEPQIASYPEGVPPPPDWLSADALTEYKRVAKEIEAAENALQFVDLSALASYAQASADFARLTVEIRCEGEVVTLPNGILAENPKLKTRHRVQRVLFQCIGSLGFSPAARARLPRRALASKSAANPFADLIK